MKSINFDISQVSKVTLKEVSDILRNETPSPGEKLRKIVKSLDSVQRFDRRSVSMLKLPFPVIWASLTLDDRYQNKFPLDVNEILVEGPLELGKDIQVAFTDKENIERLNIMLKRTGVNVLSIETARYLKIFLR